MALRGLGLGHISGGRTSDKSSERFRKDSPIGQLDKASRLRDSARERFASTTRSACLATSSVCAGVCECVYLASQAMRDARCAMHSDLPVLESEATSLPFLPLDRGLLHPSMADLHSDTIQDDAVSPCAGGVKLLTPDYKLCVDNTLNGRMDVVLAQKVCRVNSVRWWVTSDLRV